MTQQYGLNLNGTGAGPHQARRVNGVDYSYNALGNLTSGGGRTYTWTADNLPASVTSGGVTESYGYDGDGERVKLVRGSTTTIYLEGLWEEPIGGNASGGSHLLPVQKGITARLRL